jgi:hypothetical protein
MNWNMTRTVTDPALLATSEETPGATKSIMNGERGRYAILAGWLITMAGIVGYIVAMSRAGANASMLDAFTSQGLLGWVSAALLAGGVVIWFVGNFAALQDLKQVPGEDGE